VSVSVHDLKPWLFVWLLLVWAVFCWICRVCLEKQEIEC